MQVGNPHTRRRKWDQVVILSVALVLSEAKELSAFLGARLLKRRDTFLRKTQDKRFARNDSFGYRWLFSYQLGRQG